MLTNGETFEVMTGKKLLKVDFTDFAQSVSRIVSRLFSEDWKMYGTKATLESSNGFPKYQGFLFVGTIPYSYRRCAQNIGTLLNMETSAQVLMDKFSVLQENPNFMASVQGRRPEAGIWGGAIRSSFDPNVLYGGTGLLEVVDHVVIANNMHDHGLLSNKDYKELVSYDMLYHACEAVGMSEEGYEHLYSTITRMQL
jgi:hypothetical protein